MKKNEIRTDLLTYSIVDEILKIIAKESWTKNELEDTIFYELSYWIG